VSKTEAPEYLLTAIRSVLAGKRYPPAPPAALVTDRLLDGSNGDGTATEQLTDRELEVFEMLAVGAHERL
jgi:DNA-binding NarL/FixJ family response regulator